MCLASSRNSAAVATGVLLTGSRSLVTASLPPRRASGCEKRHGLADVCAHGLYSEATTFLSTQQTLLTGAWGMAQRASFFILTSGRTVASLSRRSPKRLDGDSEPCSHHSLAATQKNVCHAAPRAVLGVGRPRSDESGRVATPRAVRLAHRPAGSALDAGKQLHLPARSPQPSWRMWVMRSRSLMARWSSSGCSGSTCNPCRRIAGNSFPAGRRRSCAPVPFGDRRAVTAPSAGSSSAPLTMRASTQCLASSELIFNTIR